MLTALKEAQRICRVVAYALVNTGMPFDCFAVIFKIS